MIIQLDPNYSQCVLERIYLTDWLNYMILLDYLKFTDLYTLVIMLVDP